MWVFLKDSFFSIVENENDNRQLLVRARVRGDIERRWPDATVQETPDNDYRFRAFIDRSAVASAIEKAVKNIDYPNYKNSISQKKLRSAFYAMVWHTMWRLQEVSLEHESKNRPR